MGSKVHKEKGDGESKSGRTGLPFSASVTADPPTKARLINNLTARYSQPRKGIHVSDLVYCLRASAFRKLSPKPSSEKELSYYCSGKACHDVIEGLHGARREVEHTWEGIVAHFDLLEEEIPVEIKSSRSPNREIKKHWIRQLGYYCAVRGVEHGRLVILYLFPQRATKENPTPTADMIQTFEVKFQKIEEVRRDLRARRDLLSEALKAGNPALAPTADRETAWLCDDCAYRNECAELGGCRQ